MEEPGSSVIHEFAGRRVEMFRRIHGYLPDQDCVPANCKVWLQMPNLERLKPMPLPVDNPVHKPVEKWGPIDRKTQHQGRAFFWIVAPLFCVGIWWLCYIAAIAAVHALQGM